MASNKQRQLVSEALEDFEKKGGKITKVRPGRAKGLTTKKFKKPKK